MVPRILRRILQFSGGRRPGRGAEHPPPLGPGAEYVCSSTSVSACLVRGSFVFGEIFGRCLLVFVICYVVEDGVFRPYWLTVFSNFMFQGTYRRSLHCISKYDFGIVRIR